MVRVFRAIDSVFASARGSGWRPSSQNREAAVFSPFLFLPISSGRRAANTGGFVFTGENGGPCRFRLGRVRLLSEDTAIYAYAEVSPFRRETCRSFGSHCSISRVANR